MNRCFELSNSVSQKAERIDDFQGKAQVVVVLSPVFRVSRDPDLRVVERPIFAEQYF